MVATAMASKPTKSEKPEKDPDEITSMKVKRRAALLAGQAAKMRNQKIEELFDSADVLDFFTHLIVQETEKLKSNANDRR